MGMDVYSKDKLQYFRATIWSWRPICYVMIDAGFEVPESWYFNDGSGLDSPQECKALSSMVQKWLDDRPDMNIFSCEDIVRNDGSKPYRVAKDHIQEWCEFLNEADGFSIF